MHSDHLPLPSAVLMVCASLGLLGCRETEQKLAANEPAPVEVVEPEPPEPAPQAPLDREGLIRAALGAATAAALRQDDSEGQAQLKGRRFELRMRFGCPGSDPKAASRWSYDEGKGVLRARVEADLDGDRLQASQMAGGDYEGAVGFTIRHPWMLAAGCPDPKFAMQGPAISVVQLFTESDSRVQRPESSHEAITPLKPEEIPSQGLSLVISGRLETLADGRAVHCSAANGPPACVIFTLIDRVAIEDPARKVVLGEWGAS